MANPVTNSGSPIDPASIKERVAQGKQNLEFLLSSIDGFEDTSELTSSTSNKTKEIWTAFKGHLSSALKWLAIVIGVALIGAAVVAGSVVLGITMPAWLLTAGVIVAGAGAALAVGAVLYGTGATIQWAYSRCSSENDW